MLIRNAEIFSPTDEHQTGADIRIANGRIAAIGSLTPDTDEQVLDAEGAAVLPGLHDHHIHLLSYAASFSSICCGPPEVESEADLLAALQDDDATGWLRGRGYHESVAGPIDRHWLDRQLPDRPARVQHRSGRLWILNTAGLNELQHLMDSSAEVVGRIELPEDGRLYDQDRALGYLLGREMPPVEQASRRLAGFGVTGLTDMTPTNTGENLELFRDLKRSGRLLQTVQVAGTSDLPYPWSEEGVTAAATKVHLHESDLPPFPAVCALIRGSHAIKRPVAVHCVTEVELVFTLAAFSEVGVIGGDRIEHASVTPPALLGQLETLGLTVVSQPNFIAERGDAYLCDVPKAEQPWLYRARGFIDAGIPLAGGTDAPFGNADPWIAIRAAVSRETANGHPLGVDEALSPEAALSMFLGEPSQPDVPRALAPGSVADLCVLREPWHRARKILASELVRTTLIAGEPTAC